jgi:hypothetical protein
MKLRCNDTIVRRFAPSRYTAATGYEEARCLECGQRFGVHDTRIIRPLLMEHSCLQEKVDLVQRVFQKKIPQLRLRCDDMVVRRFRLPIHDPALEAKCLECGQEFDVHDIHILEQLFAKHTCTQGKLDGVKENNLNENPARPAF